MKKLFLMVALAVVSMFSVKAFEFSNLPWSAVSEIFVSVLNEDKEDYEEMFAEVGIDAKFNASYEEAKKTLVLTFAFDQAIYDALSSAGLANELKNTMLEIYRQGYKSDSDFKDMIDLMKKNNATFTMRFTSKTNPSKKVDLIIKPNEIIN